jgi:hypothetical protein
MHLPRFLRRVNRVFTNPLLGTVAWLLPPLAVVHHVGRADSRDKLELLTERPISDPPRNVPGRPRVPFPSPQQR